MRELYSHGPDCCGPDDSAYGPERAAGGPQEPRSDQPQPSPTSEEGSALTEAPTAKFPDPDFSPLYGGHDGQLHPDGELPPVGPARGPGMHRWEKVGGKCLDCGRGFWTTELCPGPGRDV